MFVRVDAGYRREGTIHPSGIVVLIARKATASRSRGSGSRGETSGIIIGAMITGIRSCVRQKAMRG